MSMKVGNKSFIDSFLFIRIVLLNFQNSLGWLRFKKATLSTNLSAERHLINRKLLFFKNQKDCYFGQNFSLQLFWYCKDCDPCNQPTSSMEANINHQNDLKCHPVFLSTSQQFAFEDGQFSPKCLFGETSMKKNEDLSK